MGGAGHISKAISFKSTEQEGGQDSPGTEHSEGKGAGKPGVKLSGLFEAGASPEGGWELVLAKLFSRGHRKQGDREGAGKKCEAISSPCTTTNYREYRDGRKCLGTR